MAVVIETTLGDLTVDLFIEHRPRTCLNFLKLCKLKYYNYNLFHMIRQGFIAQTGDPTGEGTGGQSVWGVLEGPSKSYFGCEKMPKIKHTDLGLLSMVTTDEGMVGSQFFFTLAPDLDSLDSKHCVIGQVMEGHDVLRLLNDVICDTSSRPYQDVRITHTVVLEDPFDDPKGLKEPSRSPSPSAERLAGGRIAPDEEIDDMKGKSEQEIQEMIEEREAKARATILEIVGDLPDAEMAPPENVLFVCKLNPVTNDDDLEIIFSRFGKIKCCEVIRDKKSGDSLQYAFIEFEDKKACEDAYFKMDNVLIDDRRIHVDFSQSVSKIKWKGKGRGVIISDDVPDDTNRKIDSRDNRRFDDRQRPNNRNYEQNNRHNDRLENSRRDHNKNSREDSYSYRDRNRNGSYDERRRDKILDDRRRDRSPNDRRRNRSPGDRKRDKTPDRKRERSPGDRRRERSPDNKRRDKSPDVRKRDRSPEKRKRDKSPEKIMHRDRNRQRTSDLNRESHYYERRNKTPDKLRNLKENRSSNHNKGGDKESKERRQSVERNSKQSDAKLKDVKSKKRKHVSDSSSDDSTPSKQIKKYKERENKNKVKKNLKKNKKRDSSSESSSDSDDSSDSSLDAKKKSKKSGTKKIEKSKKSKKVSDSSSSSSESSSTSDDSSSDSDSGHDKRKKYKSKKSVREKSIKKKKKHS